MAEQVAQTYEALDRLFRDNRFPELEAQEKGLRYLKVRSFSRNSIMERFFTQKKIPIPLLKSKYAPTICMSSVPDEDLDVFIKQVYSEERNARKQEEGTLQDQLSRLQVFDWGGSFQNSLEKTIVDKYVKQIKFYIGM